MLCWNIALWLAIPSSMTVSNQSEYFISAYHIYTTLKFVYNISSGHHPIKNILVSFDATLVLNALIG